MDQESFRKILNTSRTSTSAVLGGGSRARISLAPPPPKSKTIDASHPAFKPRTVKKTKDPKYRDRASERRGGDGNDYAHVEAVLDEFEKRNASTDKATLEAQRKYLGGDAEHSILVKGLDFALLEQNKARSVLTNEDVDALDQAYKEASSHEPVVPKKRTREDILAELKKSREGGAARKNDRLGQSAEEETRLLEEAKQKGKFKPIGFKPIGSANDKKKRTSTTEGGGQKKKKKLKAENGTAAVKITNASTSLLTTPAPSTPIPEEPEAPVDDDFDIFADAGDYKPLDLDEGEDDDERKSTGEGLPEASSSISGTRWIANNDTDPQEERPEVSLPASTAVRSESPHGVPSGVDEEDMEDKQPQRLVPLFSSALPSIKDLLAADKAAGSHKRRKDKKKAPAGNDNEESKKRSLESKVDRDYKRLKTYTDKKAASLDNGG